MARAEGIRVTEFFLGFPCKLKLSFRSRKYGTEYGVTPLLLGGYNRICGLGGNIPDGAEEILAYVQDHGRVNVREMADSLGYSEEDAYLALSALSDWASVEPYYDAALGEKPNQKDYPKAFQTVARDASLRTRYDVGFDETSAVEAGSIESVDDAEAFFESEKARTYQGKTFWQRVAILVTGPLVNLVFGFVIAIVTIMYTGYGEPNLDTSVIGDVVQGFAAENAGLQAGDEIIEFDGHAIHTWEDLTDVIDSVKGTGASFDVVVLRDGETLTLTSVPIAGNFGITASSTLVYPDFMGAAKYAFDYLGQTLIMFCRLFVPTETMDVMQSSTSIVGITVSAGKAAERGFMDYLSIAAMVSVSLGWANLLPIPPLDGGRILVEALQRIRKRQFADRTLQLADLAGICVFGCLFIFMLQQDIFRFFG